MLTACGGSRASLPNRADPIVETRVETRLVCPPELRRAAPPRPVVPADAVVEANEAGARWLAAELGWGPSVLALFLDARAICQEDGAR